MKNALKAVGAVVIAVAFGAGFWLALSAFAALASDGKGGTATAGTIAFLCACLSGDYIDKAFRFAATAWRETRQ